MGESEKLEGALPLSSLLAEGGLTERDQRRLLPMNGQPEARQALGQRGHGPAGLIFPLAPTDEVVPVANQVAPASPPGFDYTHVPFI